LALTHTVLEQVSSVSKNSTINNLVEAYLKENPSRRRDDSELKRLDELGAFKDGKTSFKCDGKKAPLADMLQSQ
jgi:hypothetical protein